MSKVVLSIIIPCYNSEDTLEDTLRSVSNQNFGHWEAIIVNDESPDNLENIALPWTENDSRFKYFKKKNGGLGSARNFGILKSKGKYILPLDSDNLVKPEFAVNALNVFESRPDIGVVYGNAQFLGDEEGIWTVGPFEKYKLLIDNYIDACAIIKKEIFDNLGLYDENLPYQGHEDWEFWLRVIKSKYEFFYLDQLTFDYRVSNDSMIKSLSESKKKENVRFIQKNIVIYTLSILI